MILTKKELAEKITAIPDDAVILIESSDSEYYPRPISDIFQAEDSRSREILIRENKYIKPEQNIFVLYYEDKN